MKGQASGRSRPRPTARAKADERRPASPRSIAASAKATWSPSELASAALRTYQGATSSAAAAAKPAAGPPSRRPRRNANSTPAIAPARAATTQSAGAASPNKAKTVVSATGSGFHDGPKVVTRSRCTISRPQMIHAQGS